MVMKAVVKATLAQDPKIEQAVLPYVDDLSVDDNKVSVEKLLHICVIWVGVQAP